jgi:hypothetical protein
MFPGNVVRFLTVVVVGTAYVVVVVLQLTVGERWLRKTGGMRIAARFGLTLLYGLFGMFVVATLGSHLNVSLTGDYRRGFGGFHLTMLGGVIGSFIPWLGLLLVRRPRPPGVRRESNNE